MKNNFAKIITLIALVFVAAASRLLPHPFNFTPIGGMALVGAAYFPKRWMSFALPILAFWLSNLFLDNVTYHQENSNFIWFSSIWSYLSFGLIILLGFYSLRNQRITPLKVGASAVAASTIFFLVTNGVILFQNPPLYPLSWAGLMNSYVAGIPFFGNAIAGDLFYSFLMFAVMEWSFQKSNIFKNSANEVSKS